MSLAYFAALFSFAFVLLGLGGQLALVVRRGSAEGISLTMLATQLLAFTAWTLAATEAPAASTAVPLLHDPLRTATLLVNASGALMCVVLIVVCVKFRFQSSKPRRNP